jgi:hypothetical protein
MPTHWAEIWDEDHGFFVRHDISVVEPGGYATQLGHHGGECPCSPPDRFFILVDTNGIHNTKIRFCECSSTSASQVEQLMSLGLFPATLKQPRMAFTFRVLRQAHLMNLESKAAMYDFVGTLRRLTDNAFAQETSVRHGSLLLEDKLIYIVLGPVPSIPICDANLACPSSTEAPRSGASNRSNPSPLATGKSSRLLSGMS